MCDLQLHWLCYLVSRLATMNITNAFNYSSCVSFDRDLEYIIVFTYAVPCLLVYLLLIYVLISRLTASFYRDRKSVV